MTLEIEINNNIFVLHCSGAMYWVEKRMLLISDPHLGKVSHFRKYGSAIPEGAIYKNFMKLDEVVNYFRPESICFLGDLFHSELNNEWHLFDDWVSRIDIPIVLIAGNHDIINPAKYHDINIRIVNEWELDGILLTHYPEMREDFFTLCGHVHPAVRLRGVGRQFLTLPCFFKSNNQMILPAFGAFTGTHIIKPSEGNAVYAITKEAVIAVEIK